MISEESVECTALAWFEALGYAVLHGAEIAPGETPGEGGSERAGWDRVVLERRLLDALEAINPRLPPEALEEAVRRVVALAGPSLIEANRAFHRLLTDGVDLSWMEPEVIEELSGDGETDPAPLRLSAGSPGGGHPYGAGAGGGAVSGVAGGGAWLRRCPGCVYA